MYKVNGFPINHQIKGCKSNENLVLWGPDLGPMGGTNSVELTHGEISARLRVYKDFIEKQWKYSELKDARVIDIGSLLGIKQTRFISGMYKLSGDDVLEGKSFL